MNIRKLLLTFLSLTTERFVAAKDVTLPKKFEPRFFHFKNMCWRNDRTGWCTSPRNCYLTGGINAGRCSVYKICCIKPYLPFTTTRRPIPQPRDPPPKPPTVFVPPPDKVTPKPDQPGLCHGPGNEIQSTGSSTTFTIYRGSPESCQLRIDFLQFSVGKIDSEGRCTAGKWEISGCNMGSHPPVLCGENSGQHMYASFIGNKPIVIKFEGLTEKDKLQIKTTRIRCNSLSEAPEGCLQYFTETTGVVKSFGFQNRVPEGSETFQLANMNYKVCIGTKEQYHAVKWTSAKYAPHSFFTISGDTNYVQPILALGDSSYCYVDKICTTDFVFIRDGNFRLNGMSYIGSRFCGLGFPDKVTTVSTELHVITNGGEREDKDRGNAGFCLQYEAA